MSVYSTPALRRRRQCDQRPELLASAAEGDTVYMLAGNRRR